MTTRVWVESPGDDGSAVWGCGTCERGAWCSDHTSARIQARTHAHSHGIKTVATVGQRRGPTPDAERDEQIRKLRTAGASARAIAHAVGISHAGVLKALRRMERSA